MGVYCSNYLMLGCKYDFDDTLDEETLENLEDPKANEMGILADFMSGEYIYVGVPLFIVDNDDGYFNHINLASLKMELDMVKDTVELCESLGFEKQEPKLWLFTHCT